MNMESLVSMVDPLNMINHNGDMTLLDLLAEVASSRLQTDPFVRQLDIATEVKKEILPDNSENEGKAMTLLQVSKMSDSNLLKLFCTTQSNEIKRKFYYNCRLLPSTCELVTQSFGSEDKARNEMKKHLRNHLRALLQANHTCTSQEEFVLRTVVKCENAVKKRLKYELKPPKNYLNEKENSDHSEGQKFLNSSIDFSSEKSLNLIKPSIELTKGQTTKIYTTDHDSMAKKIICAIPLKNGVEEATEIINGSTSEEGSEECSTVPASLPFIVNNGKRPNLEIIPIKSSKKFRKDFPPKLKSSAVIHDHGYIGASVKIFKSCDSPQVPLDQNRLITEEYEIKEEIKLEDMDQESYANTLLNTHMNNELKSEFMAQDSKNTTTPLPVVGSEVDFNADNKKIKIEAVDLDDPLEGSSDMGIVVKRRRKLNKAKGKFVGQSKLEKDLALKLLKEIKANEFNMNGPYTCAICVPHKLFTALSTLTSHYRSHAGIRPYACVLCGAGFTRQHSLNYHLLIHGNKTRFTCEYCGKKFRHPSHFKEHRRRHTGENPFTCPECFQKFKTRNTFKRHLKTRHKKVLTTANIVVPIEESIKEEPEEVKSEEVDSLPHDFILDPPSRHSTPPPPPTAEGGLSPIESRETELLHNLPFHDLEETFSATEDDYPDGGNESMSTISIKEGDEDYQMLDLSEALANDDVAIESGPTYSLSEFSQRFFPERSELSVEVTQIPRERSHWEESETRMFLPETSITPVRYVSNASSSSRSAKLVDTIESVVNMGLGTNGPVTLGSVDVVGPSISVIPTTSSPNLRAIHSSPNLRTIHSSPNLRTIHSSPSLRTIHSSPSLKTIHYQSPVSSAVPPSSSSPEGNHCDNDRWGSLIKDVITLSDAVGKGRQDSSLVATETTSTINFPSSAQTEEESDHSKFSNLNQLSYVALNFDKIIEEKKMSESLGRSPIISDVFPRSQNSERVISPIQKRSISVPPSSSSSTKVYKYLNSDTKVHYVTSNPNVPHSTIKQNRPKDVLVVKYLKSDTNSQKPISSSQNLKFKDGPRLKPVLVNSSNRQATDSVSKSVKNFSSYPLVVNPSNIMVLSSNSGIPTTSKSSLSRNNLTIVHKGPSVGPKSYIKLPIIQSSNGESIVLQNNNVIINGASVPAQKVIFSSNSTNFPSNSVPIIMSSAKFPSSPTTSSATVDPAVTTIHKRSTPMVVSNHTTMVASNHTTMVASNHTTSTATTRPPQVLITFNPKNSTVDTSSFVSQNRATFPKISSTKPAMVDSSNSLTLNFSQTECPVSNINGHNSTPKIITSSMSPTISISSVSRPIAAGSDISISRIPNSNSASIPAYNQHRPTGILNNLLIAGKTRRSSPIYSAKYDEMVLNS